MLLNCPGFETELWFHEWTGEVKRLADTIVVRHPKNPKYFWGNLIFHSSAPEPEDFDCWLEEFKREFADLPEVRHVSFSWNPGARSQTAIKKFLSRGFILDASTTCILKTPDRPLRFNSAVDVREIESESEWAAMLENQIAARAAHFDERDYRQFFTAKWLEYRRLIALGYGKWFAAYLNGRQVGDLGVFHRGTRARVQRVATLREYRGRGIAATLLFEAVSRTFSKLGITDVIIVADPCYHAIRIYESIGFEKVETEYTLYHPTLLNS